MYSDLLESSSKDNFSFNDQSSSYDMAEVNEISNQPNLDYIFDSYYSTVSHYNTDFDLPEDCKNMSFSELFDQELFSTHENKDCKLTIKIEKEEPLNPSYSANNSQDTNVGHSPVKIMESISSSTSSKSFAPKRGINRTFIKATKNCDVERLIHNPFYEPENLDDQLMVKVRKPIIKCELVDLNDIIEQNIVELEVKPDFGNASQNTVDGYGLMKIEENTKFSLSKNTTQKHSALNIISMKNTMNDDAKPLMGNAVGISNKLVFDQIETPIIHGKSEKTNNLIEQDIKMEKKLSSSEDSLNQVNSHSMVKIENTQFTISKNYDTKHLMGNMCCESDNLVFDQIGTPIIIKQEPEEVSDMKQEINMDIRSYSTEDSQNKINSHSLVKRKDNIQSSLLKSSIPKYSVINKTTLKITENYDIKNLKPNIISKTKNPSLDRRAVKIKTPIIKCEPEEVNDIIEQEIYMEINPYFAEDSQNKINSHSLTKRKDNIQSSLLKSSTPKLSVINKTTLKPSKNCNIKNAMSINPFETENLSFDQMSMKIITPKCEPEDINDIIEQDIQMEMKQCFSVDGSKNETDNYCNVNIKNEFTSLLSKGFTSKRQSNSHTSLKSTDNSNIKNITHRTFCEFGPVNDQMTAKVKKPVIKSEPIDLNDTVGMEIHLEENLNDETSKYTGLEDFCCNNLNCTKIESQKIAIIKTDNISNINSVKNDDIETISNSITLETEKKKISWEEYKAKVGKMGLSKISGDNDEPVTDIAATNIDKLETVKEEFDRNTAEHFIGKKRKIEDNGQLGINAKEMNSEEDQELQNKRMKIEYIKKLLPSSFASEIAKTSSLMKGNNYANDIENESTSDDSIISSDKTHGKITDIHLKKDEKSQKKFLQTRVHSSYRSSSRTEYCNKSSRLSSSSSSSNPDDYYNRNRIDVPQNGQYNQNIRNTVQRSRDQKRVVYVGQIPIKFGKRYLYNRFKTFGTIQSLTLHKKPDFRVYYAFVTYSEKSEAERAINHGNDDESQVQLDIRFGERKQTQTPYYDLDDEWLTDWYGYNQPVPVVRAHSPEKTSFEEELQEFYKLAQIKKSNQIKSSQVS